MTIFAGTPKKRRAMGRGTNDRMLTAHLRLMEAISAAVGRCSGDKEGAVAEILVVKTLLLALLAPAASLGGLVTVGDAGGCAGKYGAGAPSRFALAA